MDDPPLPVDPPAPASGTTGPLRPFRSRSFSGLWTGTVASNLGASVAAVAFSWFVYSTTQEALADRYERRRLMILADGLRAAAVGFFALFLVLRGFDLLVLLGIAGVTSSAASERSPARSRSPCRGACDASPTRPSRPDPRAM